MAANEELRIVDDYSLWYRQGDQGALATLERLVFGTDFGIAGYTTPAIADELFDRLGLARGDRLLDLGTGCGWPGLRAAIERRCKVVGSDLPLEGLARARDRGRKEDLGDLFSTVSCSARALPYRQRSFDAIVHADVLC
jgi:predicted TPR repeat methyltransferase